MIEITIELTGKEIVNLALDKLKNEHWHELAPGDWRTVKPSIIVITQEKGEKDPSDAIAEVKVVIEKV